MAEVEGGAGRSREREPRRDDKLQETLAHIELAMDGLVTVDRLLVLK